MSIYWVYISLKVKWIQVKLYEYYVVRKGEEIVWEWGVEIRKIVVLDK